MSSAANESIFGFTRVRISAVPPLKWSERRGQRHFSTTVTNSRRPGQLFDVHFFRGRHPSGSSPPST